jgi:gliding motility-associated-like protein
VSGTCPVVITRTYTVRDACNNSVNIVHVINIDDTTPPLITGTLANANIEGCSVADAPAAVTTVAALEALPGGVTVSDICTADASLIVTSTTVAAGTCPIVLTRTYTITDGCGNSSTIVHVINIDDNTAPVISGAIPPTTITGCTPADAAAVTTVAGLEALGVTVADACVADASLLVIHSDVVSGACPVLITRTYTVFDLCGNASGVVQNITVTDNEAPVIAGSLLPVTIEGCGVSSAPSPETTVAGVEGLAGGITVTDNCTSDALLTVTHSDLAAGSCPTIVTRTYTITDACGNSSVVIQNITIDDTTPPSVTGTLIGITVEGCSAADAPAAASTIAELTALAGGLGITDACTPAASLTVAHSDTQTGTCPVVLTRIYTVSDGCLNSIDITQVITIDDTTPPVLTGCPADITAGTDGGTCSATVTWADPVITNPCGITTVISSHNSGDVFPSGTTTVTITVTDECGNSAACSFNVTVSDSEAPVVTCSGNIMQIEDVGFAHATVAVPDAAFTDNCSVSLLSWTMIGATNDASPLTGVNQVGTYIFNTGVTNVTFTSVDASGNTGSCSFTVTVVPPNPLGGSVVSQNDVLCYGDNTGSFTVTGADGYPPYEYSTDGINFQASGTFSALNAAIYTVTIRDAAMGTFALNVTITQPASSLGAVTTQTSVLCFGGNTGSVTVAASGGTTPYEYSLNGGSFQGAGTFGSLVAGAYTVTVRDANGCTFVANATITQPASALQATVISQENVSCSGGNNGSVVAGGSGGTAPYEYSLNGGAFQSSGSFGNLPAGTHTVTVRDANLCTANASFTITEPAVLAIISEVTNASCPDVADGGIEITITGGTQPYSVLWSDGNTSESRTGLEDGVYSVVVTDIKGCAASLDITVGVSGSAECIVVPTIITPNSDGYNDTWQLRNIEIFPDAEVQVFNRWGERVFNTKNPAANPWDGTFKGKLLPMDSYHYVLHLNDGSAPRSGVITIMR